MESLKPVPVAAVVDGVLVMAPDFHAGTDRADTSPSGRTRPSPANPETRPESVAQTVAFVPGPEIVAANLPPDAWLMEVALERAVGPSDLVGFFTRGKAGRPDFGQIIWARAGQTPANEAAHIDLDGIEIDDIGFFLIRGAASRHPSVADSLSVHFEYDGRGRATAICGGRPVVGELILADHPLADEDGAASARVLFFWDGREWAALTVTIGPAGENAPI